MRQAHSGTRDLTFGSAVYRPDRCGCNNLEDVRRLTAALVAVDPGRWQPADLAPLTDLADEEEREEELAFARYWFPSLCDLYGRAAEEKRIIVHEVL